MKNSIKFLSIIALATIFSLSSCSQSQEEIAPQAAQNSNNANITLNTAEFGVVQNFINAINANDRNAVAPLLAANAGYAYSLTGALNTGERFRSWLESDLFAPRAVIQMETVTQNGNVVRIQGRWGRNGNATNRADYYFTVENGLITAWRLV
ncbi:MAG: nuclear transport factor 2 family protein [Thermoflexibacter sp.]|jgi:hypothetical protein|nr:nuclear transport factor 2 family protein [Thermoflexibacter sp.]